MENLIQEAFVTMLVGMSAVFLILLLVVLSAKMLIRVLNATDFILNPEEKKSVLPIVMDENHTQILERAIAKWSDGKAKITMIKKI